MNEDKTLLENFDDKTVLENFSDKTVIENDEKTIVEAPKEKINTFRNYKIIKEFPALGSEADIYLLENGFILKLYRKGITINEELISKIKDLSEKNPSIIKIIDFGFDEKKGRYYEIMEYARYGSAGDFFISTPATKEQIKTFVSQINSILKDIHEKGIIHRDLKPTNILIKSVNPLIFAVSDFGISSILDENATKKFTQVRGTPVYSAPESFTGIMGKEVDYWALGMIILEIIHKNPFKGLNPQTIMFKITSESVDVSEDIDDEIKTLVKGLLTQNRKYRWGYNQVKNWLEGKEEKVYYSFKESKNKIYKFLDKRFNTLEELIKEATKDKDTFQKFITFVKRGYINQQLMENGETELDIKLSEIIEEESSNILLAAGVIKLLAPNLTPTVYGIKLDTLNLLRIFYKGKNKTTLTNEEKQIYYILNSYQKREKLFKYLKNKSLERAFRIYFDLKKKTYKELFAIRVAANYINPENIMPKDYTKFLENDFVDALITPITKRQLSLVNFALKEFGFEEIYKSYIENLDADDFKFVRDNFRIIPDNLTKEFVKKALKGVKESNLDYEKDVIPKEIKTLLDENSVEENRLIEDICSFLFAAVDVDIIEKIDKNEFEKIQKIYRNLKIEDYLIPFEAKYILDFYVESISLKNWYLIVENYKTSKAFYEENKEEIDEIIGKAA